MFARLSLFFMYFTFKCGCIFYGNIVNPKSKPLIHLKNEFTNVKDDYIFSLFPIYIIGEALDIYDA